MKLLEGKVAVVTGAARGIGKAIALQFAKEGANVAFTDLAIDENGKATEAEIAALGDCRERFPFDIDGAVIKLDNLAEREVLGSTAKCPRWAIAYKYPPETKETVLRDIVVQV